MIRVVAAAWIRDRRLLAAQRGAHKADGGGWELPGGKVEPDETDEEALTREILEELGVVVTVHEQLATSESGVVRLVAYVVTCRDEPEAHEHQALRWLARGELHTVAWLAIDQPLVEAAKAML